MVERPEPSIPSAERLFDAHNHLHDERLAPFRSDVLARTRAFGGLVVNGSCQADWPAVLEVARQCPNVLPSFGYHPWSVRERTPTWKDDLVHHLDALPSAVGEIGLDRWIPNPDTAAQEEAFTFQMALAADRNLPASVHCLQAWGRLHDLLRHGPRPATGFLLHSYGGPAEMIRPLARLGAYFSLPGYFAHERKLRQRETFRHVPPDRLLIETDAPDQLLPDPLNRFPLRDVPSGRPLNHPANLPAVYAFAAEWLALPLSDLVAQVEENFFRLFGTVFRPGPGSPRSP